MKTMPQNNKDIWECLWDWIVLNYPFIYSALLAILISLARLSYDEVSGRKKWVEPLLCGAVSLAVVHSFEYLGLPQSIAPFAGGMIGFIGIEKIRELSHSLLDKKIGRDK